MTYATHLELSDTIVYTILEHALMKASVCAVRSGVTMWRPRLAISLVAIALVACNDQPPTAPESRIHNARLSHSLNGMRLVLPGDSAAADSLGRALALALNNGTARQQVLEDLRDSPFPQHKIHLPSYLRGPRGARLVAKMAEAVGSTPDRILQMSNIRSGLQLAMVRSVDRMFWTGTPDIAVKATPFTLAERNAAFRATGSMQQAYTTAGVALLHGPLTESAYPYLVIAPIDVPFTLDPERERAAAASFARSTVSTPDEEIAAYRRKGDSTVVRSSPGNTTSSTLSTECDPTTAIVECPDEGGGTGPWRQMGEVLPSGKNFDDCYRPGQFDTTVDRDQDGVDDGCEAELAVVFRPQIVLMSNDCDTRRQPYFASRYTWSNYWGDVILVFYAVSYVYDCGPAFTCGNSIPWCDTHRGDSEWIIVELGRHTSSTRPWALKAATLSAHWRTDNDQTAFYEASDLEDADGSPGFGAPKIWVAQNKHANYRSRSVCDGSGFFNLDNCENPDGLYHTLDITGAYNLGRFTIPFIGAHYSPVYDRYSNNGSEYYWVDGARFCGWSYYTTGSCAGPYYESLRAYGF